MSEQTNTPMGGYGYEDDEVKVSPFNFGLNAGAAKLKKFEWIQNGGKDGAEQEALEVVFTINETDKSYRMFPVTKAFIKGGGETTDPNSKEFKDAFKDLNAKINHIVTCFVDRDTYKAATSGREFKSFKDFITLVASLLPKDFNDKPLDVFFQYQWQLGSGRNITYLELPSKMSHGFWLTPAQPGSWTKKVAENISTDTREALYYVNEQGAKHPFVRNGWFMLSNFANQQKTDSGEDSASHSEEASTENTAPAGNINSTVAASTPQSW